MHAHEEPGKQPKRAAPARSPGATPSSAASSVLALQRLAGNAAVSRAVTVQRSGRESGPARGTYGYRSREAELLEEEYGAPISGRTHQHEHSVLFNVGARGSGLRRAATGAAGQPIRRLEAEMPSYPETLRAHRRHEGTGNRLHHRGATGMTGSEYRDAQHRAISDRDRDNPFTALVHNQVGYAGMPEFHAQTGTVAGRQSDAGYEAMVESGHRVPHFTGPGQTRRTRPLIASEQAEAVSMRQQMRTGQYPDAREQDRLMRRFGARNPQLRSRGPSEGLTMSDYSDLDADSDRSRSPEEAASSYRSRSRARSRPRDRASSTVRAHRNRTPAPSTRRADDYGSTAGEPERGRTPSRSRSRSRHRSRSRGQAVRGPAVALASLRQSGASSTYGYDDDARSAAVRAPSRSRSRHRSRSRSRSRGQAVRGPALALASLNRARSRTPHVNYAAPEAEDYSASQPSSQSYRRSRSRRRTFDDSDRDY
ncbi:hypothetical protein [Streptacidiphilus sp. PAMC 29251]